MAFEFVFKLSRWPITGVKSPVKKRMPQLDLRMHCKQPWGADLFWITETSFYEKAVAELMVV